MREKTLSDLEKMNKDRAKAEEEYLDKRDAVLEVNRIINEGIVDFSELVDYLIFAIEDCKHMEDMARAGNNTIAYSESIGIRRELTKLMLLLGKGGEKLEREDVEAEHSGEAEHRANNDGDEAYV